MSQVLIVHVDGLLVETTEQIHMYDPLTQGIDFVHKLYDNWLGSSLFVAEFGPPDTIRNWLRQAGFSPTWVDVHEHSDPLGLMEGIMSSMGERQSVADLFISARPYNAAVMAGEGVNSAHFIRPIKVKNWGPEPGSAWERRLSEMGESDKDD